MQRMIIYMGASKDMALNVIQEYMAFADHLLRNHGEYTAIKILKDLHSMCSHSGIGKKQLMVPIVLLGGKIFKANKLTGLPKRLKYLNLLLRNFPKAAITITAMVRIFVTKPSTDIGTIIDPFTGNRPEMEDFFTKFGKFMTKHGSKKLITIDLTKKWHTTMSSGPNGTPALLSCFKDLVALYQWKQFHDFITYLGILGMTHLVDGIRNFYSEYKDEVDKYPQEQVYLARLAFLADKAGKTRIVFILNYWCQEALYPLHSALMRWLGKQPQDGTYDQGGAAEKVRIRTEQGLPCWSFDLTAATDRWPREHQFLVLCATVGNTWALLWKLLMEIKPWESVRESFVEYKVGQPMGALASWAAFAVTHHWTLRYLCYRCGVPWDSYVILGDDLVIFDKKVAEEYVRLMSTLGVTISQGKSITPTQLGENTSAAEFAKRLFRDGVNLSPVSSILLQRIFGYSQCYWEILTIFREWYGYEAPMVGYSGTNILIHPTIHMLMQGLKPKQKHWMEVLLGSNLDRTTALPNLPRGLSDMSYQDWVTLPNPWGINPHDISNVDTLLPKIMLGSKIQEDLRLKYLQLHKADQLLIDEEGTTPDQRVVKPDHTESPYHPVRIILDSRLQNEVMKVIYAIQYNDECPYNIPDICIEIEFLVDVILGNKTYKSWMSQKDRRNKYVSNLVLSIYAQVMEDRARANNPQVSYNSDEDDCSGW